MIHHNYHFIFKIHFMFKIMRLCVCNGFLVSHHGLRKPIHRWGPCLTIIGRLSTRGRIYVFFLISDTYFLYHLINHVTLLDVVSFTKPTQSNTKHGVKFTNHALTHLNRCNECMQCMRHCVSIPCLICNECHMDHTNHASHHAFWTIITHAYNFQTSFLQC